MSSFLSAPPPFFTIATVNQQPDLFFNNGDQSGVSTHSSSSSSSSTSIMIVIIVIASAIVVSASLYLLLRFFSRRFHRSSRTYSADDVVWSGTSISINSNNNGLENGRLPPKDLFDSLPLFTFGSVTGKMSGGDCAVCLSKFEPQDQLRLLPLCCHAFHADCIDTWLTANQTCPLCRSPVHTTETDVLNKILSSSANGVDRTNSFRIEIGSVSRRRTESDSGEGPRSYSIGSFEYIVDDGYEVSMGSTHRRGASECTSVDKDSTGIPVTQPEPPGNSLAAEVAGERSWLRDYVDRLASVSSRSFRSSGRFFSGSSRRSDPVVAAEDLEANRLGEEIGELFRWLSGV